MTKMAPLLSQQGGCCEDIMPSGPDPFTSGYLTPEMFRRAFEKISDVEWNRIRSLQAIVSNAITYPPDNHACSPSCVCPDHPDLPLLYGAKPIPEHACQRPDCRYAH